MTWQETISFLTGCMPRPVARVLMQQQEGSVREIRVRAGGKVRILTAEGEITCACTPTQPQVEQMAEALCEHALYARAEEQRQGFVTLRGGHRMGLCGRVAISAPCAFVWQANGAARRMRSCPICGTSRAVCAAC